ncbi:hypothetical protein M5689_007300 [Euphorbia peplus]|nr:hypothetical protein M5689_007300 [Euphorbia peplus]
MQQIPRTPHDTLVEFTMAQPHGQQYAYQQYMSYQQNLLPQNQQISHQQFPTLAKRGDVDFQQGKQTGFVPISLQQTVTPSSQNLPVGGNSASSKQPGARGGQPHQFSGPAVNTLCYLHGSVRTIYEFLKYILNFEILYLFELIVLLRQKKPLELINFVVKSVGPLAMTNAPLYLRSCNDFCNRW